MKFLLFSARSGEGERTGQPPKMAAVSRGRGAEAEAREAAVFPGPGLYGLGLTVNWFMSRMECVGIRAPWKPPGAKTIGRPSLLWTLAVLPTLTLGLRILLLVL